jgi:tRNA(Leu) C34 or U34 (ribose-2'-O)-methylase TrmL
VKRNMQDGNREWITTVACICADRSALPPVLLFASSNSTLQSTWVKDIKATKHSAHIGPRPTGWSNDEMGLDWLKNVFDRYTKTKARNSWRMLILDGYGSHLTAAFIAYCFENKILLIIYRPHATHTLQPLDVVMFWTAWTASITRDNILQAFKSTGVRPIDPQPVLKKCHTPTTEDQKDPEFEQLEKVLDWKDLKRLYNSVVVDQSTKEAKTLASSLHYLSTQFELISAENTGLRISLQDKKKHKIKGQVLSHLTNNSGSLNLSPSTVEKALEALAQKDKEKEEELAKKASSKAARQAAKENKLALQQVAADKRKADKERRMKEVEERAQKMAQKRRERGSQACSTTSRREETSL